MVSVAVQGWGWLVSLKSPTDLPFLGPCPPHELLDPPLGLIALPFVSLLTTDITVTR